MKFKSIGFLAKKKVIEKVNPHLLNLLPFEAEHETFLLDPECLLSPNRLDVMAKYIYAQHRERGVALDWAISLYREHLRVWGGFVEGDGSGKDSFEKYLAVFDTILDSIKSAFDENISVLPVGEGMEIIDGSHRSAACLLYGKPSVAAKFSHVPAIYDSQYFSNRGLSEDHLDQMALQYCRLNSAIFIVCVFPVALGKKEELESILLDYGHICNEKEIFFRKYGPQNLARQLYKGESWVGDAKDGYPGTISHAKNRFTANKPVRVYVFECDDLFKVKEVKSRIRSLFPLENNSIHINDSHEETVRLAEQFFNARSIFFLNNSNYAPNEKFINYFEHFKKEIAEKGYDKNDFCIDGSAVMAAFGIRDANDLDFLYCGRQDPAFEHPMISCHNLELIYHQEYLDELIYNPNNFFYYDGIKFLTLENLSRMKKNRNEEKDIKDLLLIHRFWGESTKKEKFSNRNFEPLKKVRNNSRERWQKHIDHLREMTPSPVWYLMRKAWRFAKYSTKAILKAKEKLGPYERIMTYKQYDVWYSRGTSIVESIKNGKTYEPEITKVLYLELSRSKEMTMLDIGANIGLISLNVLSLFPETKIFAFEPGPHQASFFRKTIQQNNLQQSIELHEIALSNKSHHTPFAVHASKDASGDGFFDTGRAGSTRQILLKTTTLDEWWYGKKKPPVNVVKIDTEGAELLVLMGGNDLVKDCRPIIIFEMHAENLKAYPYDYHDILSWFKKRNYLVKTFGDIEVNQSNMPQLLRGVQDYIAKPSGIQ